MSFLLSEAEVRLRNNKLLAMGSLIDWGLVVSAIGDLGRSWIGPNGYDIVGMVKGLILQSWYSLSDSGLEESLRIRLDFMHFTGFDGDVPDETTICRFRNLLVRNGGQEKIFTEVNRQLQAHNLQVKATQGAVLDASLVRSAARARPPIVEGVPVAGDEKSFEIQQESKKVSADPDATWLKKGNKYHFGYQVFATVAEDGGAIVKIHTTPANVSEIVNLKAAITGVECAKLLADKGFASKENRVHLRTNGIKTRIMYKAHKNQPLTQRQKNYNKAVSKIRYIVEQAFGTLKRKFNFAQTPYFTTEKTNAWAHLKATAFNMLKAANQIININQPNKNLITN